MDEGFGPRHSAARSVAIVLLAVVVIWIAGMAFAAAQIQFGTETAPEAGQRRGGKPLVYDGADLTQWAALRAQPSIERIAAFIRSFPDSSVIEEARALQSRLQAEQEAARRDEACTQRWPRIKALGDLDAVRAYLDDCDGAGNALLAKLRLKQLEIEERKVTFDILDASGVYETITGTNVRTGPGTGFPIVRTLPAGKRVNVTGQVDGLDWHRIEDTGAAGAAFVASSLIREVPEFTVAPASGRYIVMRDLVYRSKPASSAATAGRVSAGSIVDVTGTVVGAGWFQVQAPGLSGEAYLPSDALKAKDTHARVYIANNCDREDQIRLFGRYSDAESGDDESGSWTILKGQGMLLTRKNGSQIRLDSNKFLYYARVESGRYYWSGDEKFTVDGTEYNGGVYMLPYISLRDRYEGGFVCPKAK